MKSSTISIKGIKNNAWKKIPQHDLTKSLTLKSHREVWCHRMDLWEYPKCSETLALFKKKSKDITRESSSLRIKFMSTNKYMPLSQDKS